MKFASVMIAVSSLVLVASRVPAEVIHVDEILVSSGSVAGSQTGPVVVLTERELASGKSQTVADVLRDVMGVDVAQSGGAGQPSSVFIRGAKSEHTLVLIDGVEANDPTTTTRYFDFSGLGVENIERIEIHRGASSVRFGADAIGGVINIITKKGSGPDRPEISGELGSYQSRRLGAATSGGTTHLNYSSAISVFSTDGFSAADAGYGDEADGLHRTTASMRLGWTFDDRDDLTFTLRVTEIDLKLDASGGPATATGGDDPNYESKSRQILTGLTYKTSHLVPRLTSIFGAYVNSTNRKYLNPPDAVHAIDYREDFKSENAKVETRQIYDLNSASKLEGVLQYRFEQARSDQFYNGVASSLAPHDQSIFGAALLYDTTIDGFTLAAGARHDKMSTIDEAVFSSSVSLSYDIEATGTSFQVGYGTGFKNPSLFQLYSNFGSTSLRAEQAATFDISMEQKFPSVATATLTYFRNSYANLIDFDLIASKYSNIASAKSDGAEIELATTPIEGWKFKAAAKVLRSRDETTGLELLRRPRWSHSATVAWTAERWQTSLIYRFNGDRDDLDPVSFGRVRLPSYSTVDATVRFAPSREWELSLRLENLADVTYQDVAGYRTSRRAVYLAVSRLWSRTD